MKIKGFEIARQNVENYAFSTDYTFKIGRTVGMLSPLKHDSQAWHDDYFIRKAF